MTKRELTNFEKRCADCPYCVVKNGIYHCSECFDQLCNDIDDCPEGVTLEAVLEAEAKTVKVNLGAKDETKSRKPRERKPDLEKEGLITFLATMLAVECDNVTITNKSKIVEFDVGENHYKLDLVKQRKPKGE